MSRTQGTRAGLAVAALLSALAGCSSAPGSDPIAWWRQLEGGRLAEERPLPPNADAPYPNLGMVPARPAATEAASRARIAAGLEGDRRDAEFAAAQPLLPPAARRAAPEAAPAGGIGASLAAASAPASPGAPVASPPPAPPPARQAAAAPGPVSPVPASPAPAAPAPAATPAPFAAMPAAPPPPPRLPGVAAATVPAPAPRAPPPVPVVPPFTPGAPVAITFAPGTAILPEGAAATLRQLSATRAGRDIRVVGHGEAAGADAASQAAVLPLAFARARAIAAVLAQAGVPPEALRITAEATGRGGVARIAE